MTGEFPLCIFFLHLTPPFPFYQQPLMLVAVPKERGEKTLSNLISRVKRRQTFIHFLKHPIVSLFYFSPHSLSFSISLTKLLTVTPEPHFILSFHLNLFPSLVSPNPSFIPQSRVSFFIPVSSLLLSPPFRKT